MNDHDMIANSRQLLAAIETLADRHGLDGGDRVALVSMTLSELAARWHGPVGAVNHLRDLADVLERQIMEDMG